MYNFKYPFCKININSNVNCILKNVRNLSTEVAVKTETVTELIKDVETVSKINTSKNYIKKPQRPPFVKNIFIGTFDKDILTYPELVDKESVEALTRDIKPVQDFFKQSQEHGDRNLTKQYLVNLNKLKLLGLQASSELGCRQLSLTEACRFYECISQNTSRTSIVSNESLGIQILLKNGTDAQKNKYLRALLDGKMVLACCVSEPSAHKPNTSMLTKAILSSDKKFWILNGEKSWIINGDTADLFLVIAQTKVPDKFGLSVAKSTAFLVERNFGGITTKSCNTMGLEQTDISDVKFENTQVPVDNIVGNVNSGQDVIGSVLTEFRLATGSACIALLRKTIDKFIQHCIEADGATSDISSSEAMQSKIGEMTTTLYVIESITYLTSLLIDQYENQDCELEAAIVKVFSAEQCHNSILKCMETIGTPAYMNDHWCNNLYRDSLSHLILTEPTEMLKLIIALLGVRHSGIHLQENVRQYRNPLYYPATNLLRMWEQRRHIEDRPKLNLKLCEYLHPSSMFASELLEYSVLRLPFATETLLVRFGSDVVNHHTALKRLADAVIDIYAMTAVLGRSSRSYCIGLANSHLEMQIANAFCISAKERVQKNVKQIWDGNIITTDEKFLQIAKQTLKSKGYFLDHPLARNF